MPAALSALTTTNGFSLMPYSLYLRRTFVSIASTLLRTQSSPLALYNAPANRFVAGFIGSPGMNFLAVTPQGGQLVLPGGGQLALAPLGAVAEIGIRPEHVGLTNPGAGHLDGRVTVVENLGNTSFVYLDTAAGQIIAEADPAITLAPGAQAGIRIDLARTHAFDATGRGLTP